MIVKVGENVYGWGDEVLPLPLDPNAYGPKVVELNEGPLITRECEAEGWETFVKPNLEAGAYEIFLVAPKAWRRRVEFKQMPNRMLQVRKLEGAPRAEPKKPEPKKKAAAAKKKAKATTKK